MDGWTGQYRWTVENFSQIENGDRTVSPEFEIGGYTWRMLLYPFGDVPSEETKQVSLYLDLPHASSIPVVECPNLYFELSIINQLDAKKTINKTNFHFFTSNSSNRGFINVILTSMVQDPDSGFVVGDCLIVEAKLLIIEDDSILNSKAFTLQGSVAARSNRQDLVYFNVGGQSFKMAKSTVERFPGSLLSKMVKEFTDLVEKREELYVDRHPKAFPWIQEIYRDGDFESTLPDMTFELLQKELDFYQLPLAEELGIKQKQNTNTEEGFQMPMAELFHEIMAEIKACNLCDFPSFPVFVYYRQVGNRKEGKRRVFVVPPDNFTRTQCIRDRGHEPFDNAIHAVREDVAVTQCNYCPVVFHLATGEKFRLVDVKNNKMIELLTTEASKFGMTVSKDYFLRETVKEREYIVFLKIAYT